MAPKSRPKRTYTKQQKQNALKLYETHGPSHVERKTGIPRSTVTEWAKAAGIRTRRNEKIRAATEATIADAAKLRAQASSFAIQGAKEAFDVLQQRIRKDGWEISIKDLAVVAGILADKHLAFNSVDDDGGAAETESMLSRLADQIGGDLANEFINSGEPTSHESDQP